MRPVLEQRDLEYASAQGERPARAVSSRARRRVAGDLQGQGWNLVWLRGPGPHLAGQYRSWSARPTGPRGSRTLLDPRWKGKIGIAKPLFGTTATQAACLFVAWGDDKAKTFFRDLKSNGVQVLSGNKQVATAVGSGQLAFGLTDTDDAMGEVDAGSPVVIIYPDRKPDELGTLFIPNTLALIKGSPHPEAARALADYLLSPEIETALANGPERPDPALVDHDNHGAGRDAQDRPCDGSRLRGGGQALGPGRRISARRIRGRLNRPRLRCEEPSCVD